MRSVFCLAFVVVNLLSISWAAEEPQHGDEVYTPYEDDVRKCESFDDLIKNSMTLSNSLDDMSGYDEWINVSTVDTLNGKISEKPAELQTSYKNLHKALVAYKSIIDRIQTDISSQITFILGGINKDTEISEFLLTEYDNILKVEDDPKKSEKISKYCPLVDEAQDRINTFNNNILKITAELKTTIAQEIGTIVSQCVDLSSKYSNEILNENELTKAENDIQKTTKLIEVETDGIYFKYDYKTHFAKFRNSTEDYAAECESELGKVLQKMQSN